MGQDFCSCDPSKTRVYLVPFEEELEGFVYVSRNNMRHYFISDSLSPELTAEALAYKPYHTNHQGMSYAIRLSKSKRKAHKLILYRARRFLESLKVSTAI